MALEVPEVTETKIQMPKNIQYIAGAVILIIAVIPSLYFYFQYKQAQTRLANPAQYAQEEAKKYVAQIGKLMVLPSDETPTLATVNDKDKLKGQPFFAKSENGDKVLIYTNAKKAILYRPSLNKIIDVAPINVNTASTGSAAQAGTAGALKFVIRNGTAVVGLTKSYETVLKAKVANADIVDRDNAVNKNYTKSLLVDIAGTRGTEAEQIAGTLGLTVGPLPAGESTPSGDFLILLGSDKTK